MKLLTRTIALFSITLTALMTISCGSSAGGAGSPATPTLSDLAVTASDGASITIAKPVFSAPDDPSLKIEAYIGIDGTITVSGDVVTSAVLGPIDVTDGYAFTGLSSNTIYRVIVVTQYSGGYDVKQIVQSTAGIAPVLNDLSITSSDSGSINLTIPTFATAGNPLPTVKAYIGLDGTITASGSVITGSTEGPVDVSASGHQFTGLNSNTIYRIIVVAQNVEGYNVKQIVQSTDTVAPVLNNLAVSNFDTDSITLSHPAMAVTGNPVPAVRAYIGVDGTISVSGSTVSNSLQGPIDVSAGGNQFTGLDEFTQYRIIVVTQNSKGYDVKQIVQSTKGIAPVLNDLVISSTDVGSITLTQPTLSIAGNPTPTVKAYIGLSGTISVSGSTVTGAIESNVNVATGGYQFSGLSTYTSYKIIVVAENSEGYAVKDITQNTSSVAPVMSSLSISVSDAVSITLAQPTFSTTGNPLPTVQAYIGVDGAISVSGKDVGGTILQGPINVATGGCQFSGLDSNTAYRIIVVSQNVKGYSVEQIAQSTDQVAPVLNNLAVGVFDTTSITLEKPTLSTAGNPLPTVQAYIGLDGTISASGAVVSNAVQGPIDVSGASHQFSGLIVNQAYRIIVVAQNTKGYSVMEIAQSTDRIAPVLNNLSITNVDPFSITLGQPTLSTAGNPTPTVSAYLGLNGVITATDGVVSGAIRGPIDVSGGSYRFLNLSSYSEYKVIVVARNSKGFSAKEIIQSTSGIAPVMNEIRITSNDATSLTIAQPTFYVAGNPLPTVNAYIGLDSTISVTGTTVTGSTQGPINVAEGGYQFSGLTAGTCYKVIVVAQSSTNYSVKQIPKIALGTVAMRVYGQNGSFITNNISASANGLNNPQLIAVDANGVYVADPNNCRVLFYEGTSITPTRVYGQGGSFTANTGNNGGISANSLSTSKGVTVDAGGVYIADGNNNRVLYYPGTSTTATRVYGQGGSFTTGTVNNGGISANSLWNPSSIAVDAGGVYIADSSNNRVLYYPGTSTTATRVYGQGGSFISNNTLNISANSLWNPSSIAVDAGGVYIVDYNCHRVMYYSGTSTSASRVYGQNGNFTTATGNNGGINANSLFYPYGIAVDSGGVYIADFQNNRVLYYYGTSTTATRVYGQGGSFITNTINNGSISANSLNYPMGVAVDAGGVYIVDSSNKRVLFYSGASTSATRVYGQEGSFTTNTAINGGVSENSLYFPGCVAVDSSGVYVSDTYNNRVLYYSGTSTNATRVYGQSGSFITSAINNGGISANSLNNPMGVAIDSGGVYISDCNNHRVLYYSGTSTTATRVYGQAGIFTTNTSNNGGISANGLYNPQGVFVDAGGVYIADYRNNRVLYYSGTSTTASRVYGQGGIFTTSTANKGGLSANCLNNPFGVASDATGVYIADTYNNRLLYYSGTSTTASRVYGQGGSFTTSMVNMGSAVSGNSLYYPYEITVDAGGVYIADSGNNRILYYTGTSTSATRVWGQGGSFTTGTLNNNGISSTSLASPRDVAIYSGIVYVVDDNNHRVLSY